MAEGIESRGFKKSIWKLFWKKHQSPKKKPESKRELLNWIPKMPSHKKDQFKFSTAEWDRLVGYGKLPEERDLKKKKDEPKK